MIVAGVDAVMEACFVASLPFRGLYSGFLPRLLAAVPRSVCTVLAYERAIAFCKRDKT